jgi:hypothetical protein
MKSVVDPSVVLQRAFLLKFGTPRNGPVSFCFRYRAGVIDYYPDHVTLCYLDIDLNLLVLFLRLFWGAVVLVSGLLFLRWL